MTTAPANPNVSRRHVLWVVFAVLVAQGPSLLRRLVWDDTIILQSLRIQGLTNPFGPDTFNFFRPGKMILIQLQYLLFGADNPMPWQAVTLLAVLLTSLALLRFLAPLVGVSAALAGTLVYAVHPMHVEATAWMAATNGTWMLLAMIGYLTVMLRLPGPRRAGDAIVAPLLLLVALLLKEEAVVAPVLAGVLLWMVGGLSRRTVSHMAAHMILCVAFFALSRWVSRIGGQSLDTPDFLPIVVSLAAPWRILRHVGLFFWPFGWPYCREFGTHPGVVLASIVAGMLAAVGLAMAVWRARRRPDPVLAGLLFAVVALVPTSNILPMGNTLWAMRYLIPPSIGLALVVGGVWVLLGRHAGNRRGILFGVGCAWLAAATATTWYGHYHWRDTIPLMTKLADESPNPGWWLWASKEFHNSGRWDEALVCADRGMEKVEAWNARRSRNRDILTNWGVGFLAGGAEDTTLTVQAHTSRAYALSQLGRKDEALAAVRAGLEVVPDHPPLALLMADHRHGQYNLSRSPAELAEAERLYKVAARASYQTAETAWANLGLLYVDAGREDLAIATWRQALTVLPGSRIIRHNLGIAMRNQQARPRPAVSDTTTTGP